jgi:hypothetical protein
VRITYFCGGIIVIEDILNHLINKQVFCDVTDVSILNTGASGAKLYGVTDKVVNM